MESSENFIELTKQEAEVLKVVEKYLKDNNEIEPQYLGEVESHSHAGNGWKGYFAMWMDKGELAVCTNFGLLQTLVEAVSQATQSQLTEQQNERVSVVLSHQVERKWLDMNTYASLA